MPDARSPSVSAKRVAEILAAAKALATEYYRLTGNERHFAWERDDFAKELRERIARKDRPHAVTGGPYHRYFLSISPLIRGSSPKFFLGFPMILPYRAVLRVPVSRRV
jgi:hypothetical protein